MVWNDPGGPPPRRGDWRRLGSPGQGPLRIVLLLAGAAVVGLLLLNPFSPVSAGHIGVKTTFGEIRPPLLEPGLHFRLPFVSTIHEISVQPHTSTTDESAATHDQQNVTTRTAVTWSVSAGFADRIYRDFRTIPDLEQTVIAPIVANDMKAVISKYEAQQLITDRAQVAGEIADMISHDLARYHVLVAVGGVNITDLGFSHQYDQAIEAKQIAQQQALQARYTLEQTQTSSQAQVVQARAAADAAVATAQGQAKATVVQAEADAQAYRDKQAALSPTLLQLTAIQKWNGVLPTYTGSQAPLPFLSIPTH